MDDLVTRASDGAHLRWRDEDGILHAVEGSTLVPEDPRTFAEWTRCGSADVLPEESWAGDETLDCPRCRRIEAGMERSGQPRTLARAADFREAMRGILHR